MHTQVVGDAIKTASILAIQLLVVKDNIQPKDYLKRLLRLTKKANGTLMDTSSKDSLTIKLKIC